MLLWYVLNFPIRNFLTHIVFLYFTRMKDIIGQHNMIVITLTVKFLN